MVTDRCDRPRVEKPVDGLLPAQDSVAQTGGAQDYLHVLTLLRGLKREKSTADAAEDRLATQLEAADKFLTDQASRWVQKAYEATGVSTRDEVHAYLLSKSDDVQKRDNKNLRNSYTERVELLKQLDTLYHFFLPSGFEGPTVGKFWAALRSFVDVSGMPIAS